LLLTEIISVVIGIYVSLRLEGILTIIAGSPSGIIGELVGEGVGGFVGEDVGEGVGGFVGADVGELVGEGVGGFVGADVGELVGEGVGGVTLTNLIVTLVGRPSSIKVIIAVPSAKHPTLGVRGEVEVTF
jgi:hypothetical protein